VSTSKAKVGDVVVGTGFREGGGFPVLRNDEIGVVVTVNRGKIYPYQVEVDDSGLSLPLFGSEIAVIGTLGEDES
jgi:hypothetical protein